LKTAIPDSWIIGMAEVTAAFCSLLAGGGATACHLRRGHLGSLALWPAQAPRAAGVGLRSATRCRTRHSGCAQGGRLVAHGDAATGSTTEKMGYGHYAS